MTEGTLAASAARVPWRAYLELTKPRVVALMVFTVAVGMLLARPDLPSMTVTMGGLLGIALVAGAAAAINHLIDRRIDAIMMRTRARPLPSGTVGVAQALVFAAVLGAAGVALLLATTNPLCALLSVAALLGYAVVYSAYLKRATPQNIVIGGAAGAAPPLLGWVAVTGEVESGALLLFTIILLWTPAHFWALAIHRRDDYARAEVPMLPVTHGVEFTSARILHYSIATALVSLLPLAIGMSGWLYGAGAAVLGVRFVMMALRLKREPRWAMPAFNYSIVYLFALVALLLADHFLRT